MTRQLAFEDRNLSRAWASAVRPLVKGGTSILAPIVISIAPMEGRDPEEDIQLRTSLDAFLNAQGRGSCDTVANTIFPASMWNPSAPRAQLFERYERTLPRIRGASRQNQRGLYFQRLIQGGPSSNPNQLDFIIEQYKSRPGVRKSALQVAVFDPSRDLTTAARLGFPCLQHVTFAPTKEGLCVNAFYATQFAVERAYGNYLGLCRLGRFVASELKIPLHRMTCFTGIMKRDDGLTVHALKPLAKAIEHALTQRNAA